jgi:hypothetical protein
VFEPEPALRPPGVPAELPRELLPEVPEAAELPPVVPAPERPMLVPADDPRFPPAAADVSFVSVPGLPDVERDPAAPPVADSP